VPNFKTNPRKENVCIWLPIAKSTICGGGGYRRFKAVIGPPAWPSAAYVQPTNLIYPYVPLFF
jgi:hypothetical protein